MAKIVRKQREKKFLGALIGGVGSIIAAGVGGAINAHTANKQLEAQERMQARQREMENVANLNQNLNNTEYIDEYNNRIGFKTGGKTDAKVHYTDRIRNLKKYKCGGRNRKK